MKRNNAWSRILSAILVFCLLCMAGLSGCALLPKEEEGNVLPTVAKEEIPEYTFVTVVRTDVVNSKELAATYFGSNRIEHSFGISGLYYKDVYVEKGDMVSKGDVLAVLDVGDLDTQLENLEKLIEEHETKLSQREELKALETAKVNEQYKAGMLSSKQRESGLAAIEETYADIAVIKKTLENENTQYNALYAKKEAATIYAAVDGIVVDVSAVLVAPKQTSLKDEAVISLSEVTDCSFKAVTDYRKYYKEGDTIEITMERGGTGTYEAVIEFEKTDSSIMYLYPTEEVQDLEYTARAAFVLMLDKRDDVIAVDSDAINTGTEFSYVYYINDNGYIETKVVEIGLKGSDGYTEIISGLSEGDEIIKWGGEKK